MWWGYLVPPVANPFLGDVAGGVWAAAGMRDGLVEQQLSLSWGLLILAGVAVVAWEIRGKGKEDRQLAYVPVLLTMALVAFVCSLPPDSTIGPFRVRWPSTVFYDALPMFRSYARFAVVVQLMVALLGGIGADRLWRAGTRVARAGCVALLALVVGEYVVWPSALWRDVLPTPAHRWVVRQPGARALDCSDLTQESASIQWLSQGRIALLGGTLDDCIEPNFADKLSAAGFTHLLVRHGTDEAHWLALGPTPAGLRLQGHFRLADLFAVTAPPPPVYTASLTGFFSREQDQLMTWRWMGAYAAWSVVNRSHEILVADLDIELWAFGHTRQLDLKLDGQPARSLHVEQSRKVYHVDSLTLTPGAHELDFYPAEPPSPASDLPGQGDPRRLSFALGTWHWTAEGGRP
jgi:hypothetical protein